MITTSAYQVASRFLGLKEAPGPLDNALIVGFGQLIDKSYVHDSTAWCAVFMHAIAFILNLPRHKGLNARGWLTVGISITLAEAQIDSDVVILSRGDGPQPDATVTAAPGHVGLYAGPGEHGGVNVLAGNQGGDQVCIEEFPISRILGIRRLQ
jgi:hypothetical protein